MIGPSFTFNVAFQQWLKANAGKTYQDAIAAYHELRNGRTAKQSTIGPQFEYNRYIRDFFAANQGLSLASAIMCWRYKRSLQGHNQYEPADLVALD